MAYTTTRVVPSSPDVPEAQIAPKRPTLWQQVALGGVMLVSIFMNFYQLGQNGFGTYYYASGIRSMLDSWHNFFFVSYDPGGFVTIDKPPLGFWLEVFSAKIFGFTPFAIFFPQALSGVLSVLILYFLVQRYFGAVAGLLAALALAVSPISVVTARYHTIDTTLALALLIGAWAVLRAAETGKLRWLLLSALMVGLGFNIKMLEAYLVVPAYGLLYLLAAPRSIWTRILHLFLATLVLLVVSFSWVAAVDLTPASQRPYVGSTQDNSELSLALGYNGIERLLGRFGGRGAFGGTTGQNRNGTRNTSTGNGSSTSGTNGFGNIFGNSGTGTTNRQGGNFANFGNGNAGPTRLFATGLGGQIGWLLPFALLSIVALAWQRRWRLQIDRQQQSMIFWGMWLLTMGIFFSVAGFFQAYYTTEMAPAICALFGIGVVVMWRDFRNGGWRGWLLPIAIILTAAEQIYLLHDYPEWSAWMTPIIIVLAAIALIALVVARFAPQLRTSLFRPAFLVSFVGAGVLVLLLAPSVWAAIPVINNTTAFEASAGPSQRTSFTIGGRTVSTASFGGGGTGTTDPKLIQYLEANQGSTKFLVATASSMTADGIILATNKPVMALGGFSGSDPILTVTQLKSLIANNTIHYFLLGAARRTTTSSSSNGTTNPYGNGNAGRGGNYGGFGQQSSVTNWVAQNCTTVSTSLWESSTSSSTTTGGFGFGRGGANTLYQCAA